MAYELKDDFTDINENIWSLKRLSKDNRKIVKYLGKNSFQITVRKGDYQMDGGDGHVTERAELTEEKSLWVPTGTLIWYSFYFAFPKDFMLLDSGNSRPKNQNLRFYHLDMLTEGCIFR